MKKKLGAIAYYVAWVAYCGDVARSVLNAIKDVDVPKRRDYFDDPVAPVPRASSNGQSDQPQRVVVADLGKDSDASDTIHKN